MKKFYISIIALALLAIGVAVAGCSTGTSQVPGGAAQASASVGKSVPVSPAVTPAGHDGAAAGTGLTLASVSAGGPSLNWVEYRMNASGMLITIRYDSTNGSCNMRFEGDVPPGMPTTAVCGAGGHKIYKNPNEVSPNLTVTDAGASRVTVPAGTFAAAEKYTGVVNGAAVTYWIEKGYPVLKMDNGDILGPMELNGWG